MHNTPKRIVAVLLSVVMVLSVFGGMGFTASAETIKTVTNSSDFSIINTQRSGVICSAALFFRSSRLSVQGKPAYP